MSESGHADAAPVAAPASTPSPEATASAPMTAPGVRSGSRLASFLAAAGDADVVLSLQKTVGNQAVCRMMEDVPHDDRSDSERIEAAKRSRSPADIKPIGDFRTAGVPDRLGFIEALLGQGWVGPADELALERIWRSFGTGIAAVLAQPQAQKLLQDSLDRGVEIEDAIGPIFADEIKELALQYVAQNRRLVEDELAKAGADDPAGPRSSPGQEQQSRLKDLQTAAAEVAKLQTIEDGLRAIPVGENSSWRTDGPIVAYTAYFHPHRPPERSAEEHHKGFRPWAQVKAVWDDLQVARSVFTDRHPALQAITRGDNAQDMQAFASADPAAAQSSLTGRGQALLKDMDGVRGKLRGGRIDPLDLAPLRRQLLSGQVKPGGRDWSAGALKRAATETVQDKEDTDWWTALGLQSLTAAAFLLAPFTGGASLALTAVGVGATATHAAMTHFRAEGLSQAGSVGGRTGTAITDAGDIDARQLEALYAKIDLTVAVISAGFELAGRIPRLKGGSSALKGPKVTIEDVSTPPRGAPSDPGGGGYSMRPRQVVGPDGRVSQTVDPVPIPRPPRKTPPATPAGKDVAGPPIGWVPPPQVVAKPPRVPIVPPGVLSGPDKSPRIAPGATPAEPVEAPAADKDRGPVGDPAPTADDQREAPGTGETGQSHEAPGVDDLEPMDKAMELASHPLPERVKRMTLEISMMYRYLPIYLDPRTNEWKNRWGRMHADHFVPVTYIVKQIIGDKLDQLTPEQITALLTYEGNFQALPAPPNYSKAGILPSDWETYKGEAVDALWRKQAAVQQALIISTLQGMLEKFLAKNAKASKPKPKPKKP